MKLEYKIKLNDDNRPYIELLGNGGDSPEHKFACFELSRYILIGILENSTKNDNNRFSDDAYNDLIITYKVLSKISDEMCDFFKKQIELSGKDELENNSDYDFMVANMEELFSLPENNIKKNDKIYSRTTGLKVLVFHEMKIYELINGVSNDNWNSFDYYK